MFLFFGVYGDINIIKKSNKEVVTLIIATENYNNKSARDINTVQVVDYKNLLGIIKIYTREEGYHIILGNHGISKELEFLFVFDSFHSVIFPDMPFYLMVLILHDKTTELGFIVKNKFLDYFTYFFIDNKYTRKVLSGLKQKNKKYKNIKNYFINYNYLVKSILFEQIRLKNNKLYKLQNKRVLTIKSAVEKELLPFVDGEIDEGHIANSFINTDNCVKDEDKGVGYYIFLTKQKNIYGGIKKINNTIYTDVYNLYTSFYLVLNNDFVFFDKNKFFANLVGVYEKKEHSDLYLDIFRGLIFSQRKLFVSKSSISIKSISEIYLPFYAYYKSVENIGTEYVFISVLPVKFKIWSNQQNNDNKYAFYKSSDYLIIRMTILHYAQNTKATIVPQVQIINRYDSIVGYHSDFIMSLSYVLLGYNFINEVRKYIEWCNSDSNLINFEPINGRFYVVIKLLKSNISVFDLFQSEYVNVIKSDLSGKDYYFFSWDVLKSFYYEIVVDSNESFRSITVYRYDEDEAYLQISVYNKPDEIKCDIGSCNFEEIIKEHMYIDRMHISFIINRNEIINLLNEKNRKLINTIEGEYFLMYNNTGNSAKNITFICTENNKITFR